MRELILIGGGEHCGACIDVIETTGFYKIKGIIDLPHKIGQTILGYDIIGSDDSIPKLINERNQFFITLGQIYTSKLRRKLLNTLETSGADIITVISPHAIVSKHSKIGLGTIVMHRSTIGPNVVIGKNCIINTGANIEHDSQIGNNVHVSTHAVVNGASKIGNDCFIGSNATVFHSIKISENVIISAGSIIRKPIESSGIYFNNQLIKNV